MWKDKPTLQLSFAFCFCFYVFSFLSVFFFFSPSIIEFYFLLFFFSFLSFFFFFSLFGSWCYLDNSWMVFAFYVREFYKVSSKITWHGLLYRILNFVAKSLILILQKKKTNKFAYKLQAKISSLSHFTIEKCYTISD